jgi:flavodoxin
MRSVVVYDSQFGNTEHVSQILARALGEFGSARAAHVTETFAMQLRDVDLLVFGCPSQPWGPASPMRIFVQRLPPEVLRNPKCACFDTRVHMPRWLGRFPAAQLARQLQKLQADLVAPPEGFLLRSRKGPLDPGEADRAADWARSLAARLRSV